jgi:DNA-binding transcriptional LysR family regulator
LQALLDRRELDILLGFAAPNDGSAVTVAPMSWYGTAELVERDTIPLAVLEEPCRFREAAIRALEDMGLQWRIAVETPNLATLRAAVAAGLGITARTHLFQDDMTVLEHERLPTLPRVAAILRTSDKLDRAAHRLAELARETVTGL